MHAQLGLACCFWRMDCGAAYRFVQQNETERGPIKRMVRDAGCNRGRISPVGVYVLLSAETRGASASLDKAKLAAYRVDWYRHPAIPEFNSTRTLAAGFETRASI